MLIHKNLIHAIRQKLFCIFCSPCASDHDRINLVTNLFCQLSCFPDQLKYNRMHLATLLLRIDQDPVPGTLILTAGLLFKIECLALALSHADTAHTAVFI